MTNALDRFVEYAAEWKQTLGLSNWRFEIEPDDSDLYASAVAWPAYRKLRLSVNAELMHEHDFSDLQIESTLIHELVHALLWLAFDHLANPTIPEPLLSYHEEDITEKIAHALLSAKYPGDSRVQQLWSTTRIVRSYEPDAGAVSDEGVGAVSFVREVG